MPAASGEPSHRAGVAEGGWPNRPVSRAPPEAGRRSRSSRILCKALANVRRARLWKFCVSCSSGGQEPLRGGGVPSGRAALFIAEGSASRPKVKSQRGVVAFGAVPRVQSARDEVDGSDGDAVDGGPLVCDGPSDGHSEVVVELGGCEGTGGLDEEGARIAVEGYGVGVAQVGLLA